MYSSDFQDWRRTEVRKGGGAVFWYYDKICKAETRIGGFRR
jgi:hypothetical protein